MSLILTLGVGSLAHASESVDTASHGPTTAIGHWDGDADPSPPDTDSPVPHHHGGCHGHHIGTSAQPLLVAAPWDSTMAGEAAILGPLSPFDGKPEIEPPIL